MKIAIFSDNFYPEISGISDSIIETSKELAKRGNIIKFYVPRYSNRDYDFIGIKNKEIRLHKNIEIIRLCSLSLKFLGQGRMVIPFFRTIKSIYKFKPDIIHFHQPAGTGIEALTASKIFNIPLIGTNHSPKEELIKNIKNRFLKTLLLGYNNWIYNNCSLVSSPSQAVLNDTVKDNKKGVVIPNPINLPQTNLSTIQKIKLIKKNNLSNFNIVFCGRLTKSKGIEIVIRAIELLKDKIPEIRLILIGEGVDKEYFVELSKKMGLERNVKFLGFLNKKQYAKIYSVSQVFTIMGVESQSIAAMQAMSLGLPFLGANAGGVPEFVKDGENGFLINYEDYKNLAKKLLYLYYNKEILKKMGISAQKSVERLSVRKIADQWLRSYNTFVN